MDAWQLQAARKAVEDAEKVVRDAVHQYIRDEEQRLRALIASEEPWVDPDLYVAEWLAKEILHNGSDWNGASVQNVNEAALRKAATDRLSALLTRRLAVARGGARKAEGR